MKKRMISLSLALCLAFSLMTLSVGAANSTEPSGTLTEDDIRHVDIIFNGNAHVVDENGIDITDSFISENDDLYQSGNYDSIIDCLIDQNLAIETEALPSPPQTRLVVNGSVNSPSIIKCFKSPLTGTTTHEWIQFYFKGHYRVNDYSNTIDSGVKVTGYTTAKSSSSLTKACGITSSSWKISNNNKTITFTVKYSARIFTSPYVVADEQNGTTVFSKTLS